MLTNEEKQMLLQVARASLEAAVKQEPPPDTSTDNPALLESRGAFVTLKREGQLRGCLGYVEGIMPLIEAVAENAAAAALRDPRFPPVRPAELPQITLEISALTPLTPVQNTDDIEVGSHGLMVCLGPHRGLLLPQVPEEYGWEREEFLSQTCRKAGLPAGSWKDPTTDIFSFEAEVFGEE